ncbi:hypothetical protein K2Y11_09310 [bacterium]|nr:hypothetical protein [bacterium]
MASPSFIRPRIAPYLVLPFLLLLSGCKEKESLDARGARIAESQAHGLDDAEIKVNKVFLHKGSSYHKSEPGTKLIGVDVEIIRPTGVDLDDVELLDGKNGKSLGSFPDIKFILANGDLGDLPPPESEKDDRIRVLFIYQVPEELSSIKLRYWGKDLTPRAANIESDSLSPPVK